MSGEFQGSPDYDTYKVPEVVYNLVRRYLECMPGKEKTSDSNPDFKQE